jgi:Mg2+-importing ATPase
VLITGLLGCLALTAIPFTPIGHAIDLASLLANYFPWLAAILTGYMLAATVSKKFCIRRFGELL